MAPKRRDRDPEVLDKNGKLNPQHEIFLMAFEKPTQIYRYLKTRQEEKPIFLHRTLNYIKGSLPPPVQTRKEPYKVDALLGVMEEKLRNRVSWATNRSNFLTLTFLGITDNSGSPWSEMYEDVVRVETIVVKYIFRKRKCIEKRTVNASDMFVHPSEFKKVPAISVPVDAFDLHGNYHSTFVEFKVFVMPKTTVVNGCDDSDKSDTKILCSSELPIFVQTETCQLITGNYELELRSCSSKASAPKKFCTWETIPINLLNGAGATNTDNESNPYLKFNVAWTNEKFPCFVDQPKSFIKKEVISDEEDEMQVEGIHEEHNGQNGVTNYMNNNNGDIMIPQRVSTENNSARKKINYQFIYNNGMKQNTGWPGDGFKCPWCSRNCYMLYGLLMHLKLSHSRLLFTLVPGDNYHVDVTLNELFDGSYEGSPHDLISDAAFSRSGPSRRTTVTQLLVFRPRRPKFCVSEFHQQDENEISNQRNYISGHGKRLYYHNMTCLPVHPKDLEHDSEDECAPQWLQRKTMMMIDDFTDVNEGEKELMKNWNLHVMKNNYVGDCQIQTACEKFLDERGLELLQKNLYRNLVLHMVSLVDYGLISPDGLYQCVQRLQRILASSLEAKDAVAEGRQKQIHYWIHEGAEKCKKLLAQKPKKIAPRTNTKTEPTPSSSGIKIPPAVSKRILDSDRRSSTGTLGSKKDNEASTQKRKFSQVKDNTDKSPLPRRRSSANSSQLPAAKIPPRRRDSIAQRRY